jgi:Tol biopolymer transport system component
MPTSLVGLVLASGGAPIPAQAAFPGADGKIVFESARDGDPEVYVMNADGSGQTRLTTNPGFLDGVATWSPNGTKIAYQVCPQFGNDCEIFVMNPDGTGKTNVSNSPGTVDIRPAWSPDGTKFAFTARPVMGGNNDIYVMNADGSGRAQLTTDPASDSVPVWSPDGSKIAFESDRSGNTDIWVMNTDGSGLINLTSHPASDSGANWSPDGSKIVFQSTRSGNFDIWVMNANGSGQTAITTAPGFEANPAWSPSGTRIAFAASDATSEEDIYVMNPDGSGQTNLTSASAEQDTNPDWQPLAPNTKEASLRAKPRKVEPGEKTRLRATVTPCAGHEGDVVEFYRKGKLIREKATNASCVATIRVKVKRTTRFRAISPQQDLDHLAATSKRVKVRVLPG